MFNATEWDADTVLLTDPDVSDVWKTCILQGFDGAADYSGSLGARISSIFVILVISTAATIFPVISSKYNDKLKIPVGVYMFARYFGTGVIVATAFIHLLDPAYEEIGGLSCVGMTGNWGIYAWCPAIILASVMIMFLVDILSNVFVEKKYGLENYHCAENDMIMDAILKKKPDAGTVAHNHDHEAHGSSEANKLDDKFETDSLSDSSTIEAERSFRSQFSAFLVLEFGIIFHSVMIGLNLGSVNGDEFKTLYIVLVFHQSFEGLGIGARLSAIPWPKEKPRAIAYLLCLAYGLVTPIAIAIGIGVRTTYFSGSYNAMIITGVLDAISCGILIYTGLIELLARDFIYEKKKSGNGEFRDLFLHIVYVFFGAGIMALLGKWA